MLIRELESFKHEIADPRIKELLDNTEIPDGMCCIDNLDISFLDGRSCGIDYSIMASGYFYKNGTVQKYLYDEVDVPVSKFAELHKDCVFIAEGALSVWHELDETEITSKICCLSSCSKMYAELSEAVSLDIKWNCIEYMKMSHLYDSEHNRYVSLSERISSASDRIVEANVNIGDKTVNKYSEL